ncbi:MAG: DEAD/DEAH box helicase family protein [Ignavibacteriae bacterium]|nr:DEAD/DEAH box helicase family protein [Ignavibacteriota bacterium]
MSPNINQNPEQRARDKIDSLLEQSGWFVQDKKSIDLNANYGIAVKEYQTDIGPADYVLFANRIPLGIIEAKKEEEGHHLLIHEEQSYEYAKSKLKYLKNEPLPFVYESTGTITRFTNYNDPKPRSREVFTFHRPETLFKIFNKKKTLRENLLNLPSLPTENLRECQKNAIINLEKSLKENRPRALIQMATGSGKTFTAITSVYRLLKHAGANKVLFLVDTKNLGEQAEQEFLKYLPTDDNRKFSELYNVKRLSSSYIPPDCQVYISTIQRLYSILKGEELDESTEDINPAEISWKIKQPVPVVYDSKIPIEFFDFIVIDECHRSIYNLWKQVLDYFDSFLIGLTATPDNRTFGFFNKNIVSEYTHEQAVADGVNVGYDVFLIDTKVSKKGGKIPFGEYIDKRDRLTRKRRWEQVDEEIEYTNKELDDKVVNPDQIRTIIITFRDNIKNIYPERINEKGEYELPKTLIFAKTDSHADDIIQIVREEFAEENKFCKKLTYKTEEDPKSILAQFRNEYYPRIAVTVDMVATGTDVKPLEILLFMRDVKSKNYFEQMKGRGTRVISLDDLRKVSPSAKIIKDHFVIVDAIGVTKSLKTDSRPLERKPTVPLKSLLDAIAVGAKDEDLFLSLSNRLARLSKQVTEKENKQFEEKTKGKTLNTVVNELLNAYNPDVIEDTARKKFKVPDGDEIDEKQLNEVQEELQVKAASTFNGDLNEFIDNVRKNHEQILDTLNPDKVIFVGWDETQKENAKEILKSFRQYIEDNKNEIIALQIFYSQPFRRRELTFEIISELLDKIKSEKPILLPNNVWRAYEALGKTKYEKPEKELVTLVSLVRNVIGIDKSLTPFDNIVDKNFQTWVMNMHKGNAPKFNEEQMTWLHMIRDHIKTSFHIEKNDFEYSPFDSIGGLGKMWQLFGIKTDEIINQLNETLAA